MDFSAWFILFVTISLWSLGLMFIFRLGESYNSKVFMGVCLSSSLVVLSMFGVYTAPNEQIAFNWSYLNTFWAIAGLGFFFIITNFRPKMRLLSRRTFRIITYILSGGIILFELLFKKSIHKVVAVGNSFSIEIQDHIWNNFIAASYGILILIAFYELVAILLNQNISKHQKNLARSLLLMSFALFFLGVPIFYPGLLNIPLELKLPLFYLVTVFLFGATTFYFALFEPSSRLVRESLLKNTSNFLFIIDRNHTIKETNYKVSELLGNTAPSLVGKEIDSFIPQVSMLLNDESFLNKSKLYTNEYVLEKENGEELQIELSISPIVESNLNSGFILMGNDLTRIVETQRTLEKYNTELEKKNEKLNNFANIVSHDLKSPLNSISGFSTLIERDIKDSLSKDSLEYLAFIKSATKNMSAIIAKLLTMAQDKSEKLVLETFDLRDLLQNVLLHLGMKIKETGATIHLEDLGTISADRIQFMQLFQNLVENSLKYRSPERSPEIRIYSNSGPDSIEIFIVDNGIGISAEQKRIIFEKYKQLDAEEEGIGLGLSTCMDIVTKHNGTLRVESEEGLGSTFIISIPHSDITKDSSSDIVQNSAMIL